MAPGDFVIGRLQHRVTLTEPVDGPAVPDGNGGYTQATLTLASRVPAAVTPASAHALERLIRNTSESIASHIVTLRYIPGVTTRTVVTFHDGPTDRTLYVAGTADEGERHRVLQLVCNEGV